jgi:Tfp pilus assembly PilM family ATPase
MIIRDFTLPDGPAKQLDSMVKNEMLHNYSASSADVIQFIKMPAASAAEEEESGGMGPLRRKSAGAGAQTGIRAATVKKDLVDSYYQLLKKLKFTPVAMDFHANAIEKLVKGVGTINDTVVKNKNYLMVDFGSSGTIIHAAADNRVFISRYIPLGVNDLDQLLVDREFIPMEEAQFFRREKLDLQSEDDAQGGPMKTARAFLYQWSDEIQKVLKFFMGRKGVSEVECLYLYGAGSLIRGLPDYLSAAVGTKAARLESFSGITFKNAYDQSKLPYCLNAAGAAIRLS